MPEPKYSYPKILLVDTRSEVEAALQKSGYDVSWGTFGHSSSVPKSGDIVPVSDRSSFSNDFTERDIVIVDLERRVVLPEHDEHHYPDVRQYWASCEKGFVDPRPLSMFFHRDYFDRTLNNGGVFIIFATPREQFEYAYGRIAKRYGFIPEQELVSNTWSFLHDLDDVTTVAEPGTRIVVKGNGPVSRVLSRYSDKSKFLCYLEPNNYIEAKWQHLAENKFGQCVAGAVVSSESSTGQGAIIILPQIADQANFIKDLFDESLPEFFPHLFPHIQTSKWLEESVYKIPGISKLEQEITRIKTETEKKIASLQQQIEVESKAYAYTYALLQETGDLLKSAVGEALRALGFKDVIDVDQDIAETDDRKREDLRFGQSPLVLVEVKGISGIPKDAAALQVAKYIPVRMKQFNRTDIRGLAIINHQRHIPALGRADPFHSDIQTVAHDQDIGLVSTFTLFRLLRNYLQYQWKHEYVRDLFYKNGVIEPIPLHYEYIGQIEEVWEKQNAFGIRLKNLDLKSGSRIAVEGPVDFYEQDISSLEVERQAVATAEAGALAGVLSSWEIGLFKKGMRVFRVKEFVDDFT